VTAARQPPTNGARAGGYAVAVEAGLSAAMLESLAQIAPGQPLRAGVDRILQASMGALVVVGDGPDVLGICSGGFLLDAEFTPQRLSELAKMDGAIILAADTSRIARANVHLVPNPNVPTSETGTRHRTAERVAKSVDVTVISVSEDMGIISVYRHDQKRPLEATTRLLNRANQALQTLERYKSRLDAVSGGLTALEVEDLVTARDVVTVLQRAEMVRRIAEEIEGYIVETGSDGRLIRLQLEELMGGVDDDRRLVLSDYVAASTAWTLDDAMAHLGGLTYDELLDPATVAELLRRHARRGELDTHLQPRGFRLLGKVPRLPKDLSERLVERFGDLQKIMRASTHDLSTVDGISGQRAQAIKEGLARLAETSILDRYS
jgi:diadenylate cyclase